MKLRSKVAVLLAEFLGTAILATAVINIARSQIGIGYFVAIGAGITLSILVLAFARVSGSHLNPAVTLGLWTIRKISTINALSYIAVQALGGLAAWQLANYFAGQEIMSVAPDTFEWKALVAEAAGTFVFTFIVAAAIFQDFKDGKLAALIGGGLFAGIVFASLASNAVLNPAVALANQSWSKAYIFGPLIGGVIGFNLYVLFFAPVSALVPGATDDEVSNAEDKKTVAAPKAPKASKSSARVVSTTSTKKAAAKKPAARRSTAKKK